MLQIFLPDPLISAGFEKHLGLPDAGVRCEALDQTLVTPVEAEFPRLAAVIGSSCHGEIITPAGPDAEARFRYLASAVGLNVGTVTTMLGGNSEPALAFIGSGTSATNKPWNSDWVEIWRAAGAEILSYFGDVPPEEVNRRLSVILSRAWSRVLARRNHRASLSGFSRRDIDIRAFRRPYSSFFTVEEYKLSHARYDGRPSDVVERAVFVAVDAVTVLPYDPVRDRVLMVEQIRMSPLAHGDHAPWLLEPVAGRIEPGQSPEEAAHREAEEEAGLKLRQLVKVADYYPSTGCFSEYVYSFVGLADLPDDAAGLGGLVSEGEDIRAHVFDRKEMMRLISAGLVPDAPALLTAFWLEANLAQLRALG